MKKITGIFISLLALMSNFSFAQINIDSLLFSESTKIYKHKFNIDLPNNIKLEIELLNLNDWQKSKLLKDFKNQAGQHINHYKSEMELAETNVFSLSVRNHTSSDYQKIVFNSRKPLQAEVVFKDNEYFNLKTEKDSFQFSEIFADSVIWGIDDIKIPEIIRYSFTAKSLLDIEAIHPSTFLRAQKQMDSLVTAAQSKVRNPKANWYTTKAYLDLKKSDVTNSKLNYNRGFKQFTNNIRFGVNYGVGVFGSNIAPTLEVSIGLVSNVRNNSIGYVGINYGVFSNFIYNSDGYATAYVPIFLDFGTVRNSTGFIQGKSSVGLGLVTKAFEGRTYYMPGVQLNFAISNTISTSFIMASEWRKNAEHHIWAISLKYNL